MPARLLRLALLTVALAGVAAPAAAAPRPTPTPVPSTAADAKVVTFGVQPAGATEADGRGWFSFSATPGAHLSDHAAVRNYSVKPIVVTLSATDATNTTEGDFALLPGDAKPKDAGAWITLHGPRRLTIAARSTVIVPFGLVVPRDASPGDHVGGVVVTLHAEARNGSGQVYELLQNVGARVFVRVSGPADARLAIEHLRVRYRGTLDPLHGGRATVTYDLRNAGNVALGGQPSVRVSGPFAGVSAATPPPVKLLLPGSVVSRTVVVDGVYPQGPMTARVRVAPLSVPGSPDRVPMATAAVSFRALPAVPLGLAVALLGLLGWGIRRRLRPKAPRGRRRAPKRSAGRHRAPGDNAPVKVAAFVALVLAVLGLPGPARADGAPFDDQNVAGSLGFCDQHGHAVTSGNVADRPFAWTIVSSAAAPAGFDGKTAKATLYGFQPREKHDPGEWSGQQFTASSTFSNPAHPMAQATYGDRSLLDFVQAFPAEWDGLVQLRLYFSAPGVPVHSRPYPATTIRVTGDRWSVVGDTPAAACDAGTATSIESVYLPPKLQPTSPPPPSPGAPGSPGASAGAGARDAAAARGRGRSGSDGGSSSPLGLGGHSPLVGAGLALLALVGATGGVLWWRHS